MSKFFKDVNEGDILYFVTSNSEGVSLSESRVKGIHYAADGRIEFQNDFAYCGVSVDSYISDNSVSIKTDDYFIAVYTERDSADACYASLIENERKRTAVKEHDKEEEGVEAPDMDMLYTKEELDAMTGKEFQEALDNMSFHEMLYHGLETLKDVFGQFNNDPEKENESTERDSEGLEGADEDRCACIDDKCKCNDECLKYPIPSSDAIIKKMNIDKSNLNNDGGLNSVPAVLVITVKESGIYNLDENHFDGCNPLFQGPKFYFHQILIPDFKEGTDEKSIDSIYRVIEDWIYEEYPEFEALEYGEDWEYDILRGQDYTVNTDEVDFNIFE